VERKAAIINVSKGLLNVSLVALSAVGGATGNPLLAGAAAIPQAVSSSGILKPFLEKKREEHLELPIPPWWTGEPQSWQTVCSSIEYRLPEIIKGVEDRLHKETSYPSSAVIKQIFIEQVAQQLSPWEVQPQDRYLVAGYVTPPLIEKTTQVLKMAVDTTRQDAIAQWLAQIASTLDTIQRATVTPSSLTSPGVPATQVVSTAAESPQKVQVIAALLEQKRQQSAYDVYISYDEADETEVMDMGEKLKVQGILPWLDLLDVRPGTPEMRRQEEQVLNIPVSAVVVGKNKIVGKQELQMYSFIGQFIERNLPVIPVILTSAPKDLKLPPYLGNFRRVDFHRSVPDPMGQFIWGITGKRP